MSAHDGASPSANRPYPELTLPAVLLGVVIGAVMNAAFVYVALKLGFTPGGSTVAAILGFAVLRGVFRGGTIIENNINQTVASGINVCAAGVAFTLPALYILGLEDANLANFSLGAALLSGIAGAFLGVVVILPLRKQMVEFERLRFPSGIAVASLLKSPGAGRRQAILLGAGFAFAAVMHVLASDLVGILSESLEFGHFFGLPEYAPLAISVSFASIGAGILSGSGGLAFVFGGMLAWWVISPAAFSFGWLPSAESVGLAADSYASWATWKVLYGEMLRPAGIGILIGGALSGVIASFPALRSAIKSLSSAAAAGTGGSDELPASVLYGGIIASVVVLFVAAMLSSQTAGVGHAALIAIVGTLWLGLAGLIVAQASGMTDISPISGMSLIGVTLLFFLSSGDVAMSVILGVAISLGIGQCADMMHDLKSGHLVGATPRRQQLAQFAVAWIGAPVAVGVVHLLWTQGDGGVGGFGPTNPELSAPQGAALAAIIDALRAGAAPLDKYTAGAVIGLGLGLYPVGGLGVLVGLAMYLPFDITLTYGLGCFIAMGLQRAKGAAWMGSTMVPVAAGFIIGEALTSLVLTVIKVAGGS